MQFTIFGISVNMPDSNPVRLMVGGFHYANVRNGFGKIEISVVRDIIGTGAGTYDLKMPVGTHILLDTTNTAGSSISGYTLTIGGKPVQSLKPSLEGGALVLLGKNINVSNWLFEKFLEKPFIETFKTISYKIDLIPEIFRGITFDLVDKALQIFITGKIQVSDTIWDIDIPLSLRKQQLDAYQFTMKATSSVLCSRHVNNILYLYGDSFSLFQKENAFFVYQFALVNGELRYTFDAAFKPLTLHWGQAPGTDKCGLMMFNYVDENSMPVVMVMNEADVAF
ncbi:MAG: hypothetical protein H7259_05300, partial [Cytophagales bacterium]|nr:hypothetical protein [Cytophaga sp.]